MINQNAVRIPFVAVAPGHVIVLQGKKIKVTKVDRTSSSAGRVRLFGPNGEEIFEGERNSLVEIDTSALGTQTPARPIPATSATGQVYDDVSEAIQEATKSGATYMRLKDAPGNNKRHLILLSGGGGWNECWDDDSGNPKSRVHTL